MSLGNQPYLKILETLNLYNPTNVYSIDNNRLNNTISTVASLVGNTSINFSNTLLGSVLLPNNTPLQQIATQELAKSFAIRFANTARSNYLPSVSLTNIFDIHVNKPLKYWRINGKDDSTLSELLKSITGFQLDENPIPFISSTFSAEDSNNFLKKHRGQGQIDEYNKNIERNVYSDINFDSMYGNESGRLNPLNIKKGLVDDSLASKNEKILADNSLVKIGETDLYEPNEFERKGDKLNPAAAIFKHLGDDGIVKSLPKGGGTFTNDEGNRFFRSFTKLKRYDSTGDLMKFKHGSAGSDSVLQTVFPNIAPLREDVTPRNLMFSIENLAFIGATVDIKKSQQGPNGGRLMWFAPYDLTITESINANWDKVDFIGRSEPVYTYNGTERGCNIGFTLIADYPAELNNLEWNSKSNNEFDKFFRGDNNLTKKDLTATQKVSIEVKKIEEIPVEKPKPILPPTTSYGKSNILKYYFDNDDFTLKTTLSQDNKLGTGQKSVDKFNANIDTLIEFLNTEEGSMFTVVIDGSSSALYTKQYNKILSFFRCRAVYNRIFPNLQNVEEYKLNDYNGNLKSTVLPNKSQTDNDKFKIRSHGESNVKNTSSTASTIKVDIIDRYASLYLEYNPKLDNRLKKTVEPQVPKFREVTSIEEREYPIVEDEFYFERLKANEDTKLSDFNSEDIKENLLKTYAGNIKYFMPVFHSQTPIDLNERTTFLHQCSHQGQVSSDTTNNSIFGKPPVCVLRLGDFFHTKIVINSIQLDYEPLLWDTNPEGIGMQPMLCKVNLSCYVVGGSSLSGPISRLQNALDFNYYANTEVYEKIALTAANKAKAERNNNTDKTN